MAAIFRMIGRMGSQISTRLESKVLLVAGVLTAMSWLVVLLALYQPYWFDEAQTIYYVRQGFARMLVFVANDFAPPLYHIFMFVWVRIFGDGEISTVIPSLTAGVLSVWLTFRLAVRLLPDRTWAMLAAFLYASSFSLLWYAQETRMYTILLALGLSSTLAFHTLLHQPSRTAWWWYVMVTSLGIYTHYPFWFLVYAQNFVLLYFFLTRRIRLDFRRWIFSQIILVGIYLPWAPFLIDRVLHWYLADTTMVVQVNVPLEVPCMALGSIFSPYCRWGQTDIMLWPVMAPFAVLCVVAILGSVLSWRRHEHSLEIGVRPSNDRAVAYFFAILAIVPVAIVGFLGVNYVHYAIFVAPFLCCLMMIGVARAWRPKAARTVALVIIAGAAFFNSYYVGAYALQQIPTLHMLRFVIPSAAAYLQTVEKPGKEVLVFVPHDIETLFRYYYHGQLPMRGFMPPDLAEVGDVEVDRIRWINRPGVTRKNAPMVQELIRGYEAAWLPGGSFYSAFDQGQEVWRWFENNCQSDAVIVIERSLNFPMYRYVGCPGMRVSSGGVKNDVR